MVEQTEIERLRRELRALVKKVNDPEAVVAVQELVGEFQELLAARVRVLTTEGPQPYRPYSWADIARPFGITRQAAWKRYAAREERRDGT